MSSPELTQLALDLRKFARERDWEQFHSPKNLCMALSAEAAEITEHFQWLTEAQSSDLPEEKRAEVRAELADTFIYLVRLADQLGVDLVSAAQQKMLINAQKYPVKQARGNAGNIPSLINARPMSRVVLSIEFNPGRGR